MARPISHTFLQHSGSDGVASSGSAQHQKQQKILIVLASAFSIFRRPVKPGQWIASPAPLAPIRFQLQSKFGLTGLTPVDSLTMAAPRVQECPVRMEAVVAARHGISEDTPQLRGAINIFELGVQRVHVRPDLLLNGAPNRIAPDKWHPLIMSFQNFYGLSPGQIHSSKLADIP